MREGNISTTVSPIADSSGVPVSLTLEYEYSKMSWFHDHEEEPPKHGLGLRVHDWKSYLSVLAKDINLPLERVTDIDVQLQLRINGESVYVKDWHVRVGHLNEHMIRGTYKYHVDDEYIKGQTDYLNLYIDGYRFERMNFIVTTKIGNNVRLVPIKRCFTIGNFELDESKKIEADLANSKLIITFRTDGSQFLRSHEPDEEE